MDPPSRDIHGSMDPRSRDIHGSMDPPSRDIHGSMDPRSECSVTVPFFYNFVSEPLMMACLGAETCSVK
jgi:hypothetical protein